MGRIKINDHSYTFEDIQLGNWIEQEAYFSESLTFCQEWLNGKTQFELQTSGSTGTPKKISISRTQMEISAASTRAFFKLKNKPHLLICINTQMIGGKMMLVRGMEWDADISLVLPESNPLKNLPLEQDIDFCAMVPMQVEACMKHKFSSKIISKIRALIIGGAPTSESLLQLISKQKLNAFQTYGMTETVSHIALAKIDGSTLSYQTLPNVIIGVDETNRLWIEAPMAQEKRLQTNDLVEIIDESNFRWIGRADFTINSGGIKIQPEKLETELEEFILATFGKVSYFVYGQKDEQLGQKLILIIESSTINKNKAQELLYFLKDRIHKYHRPKEILLLDQFVRTKSGKINRTKTAELCI